MKSILILSFLYEDDLCLREFELLKEHYNKIIDYFCFPMKYYGVRATTKGKTRIDEENQIIWLYTDNIEEYDKKLIYKVVDCFKFIEKNNIEYDVIIKGNTSTYLNLIRLNREIQKNNDNTILTSTVIVPYQQKTVSAVARGNCLCLLKKHIIIISNIDSTYIEECKRYLETNGTECSYVADDVYISLILINENEYNVRGIGQCSFSSMVSLQIISSMNDVFSHAATCIKNYDIIKYRVNDSIIIDEVLLRLVIKCVEERVLIEPKYNYDIISTSI